MWVNGYFTFAYLSFYDDADLAEQRKGVYEKVVGTRAVEGPTAEA